MFLIRDSLSRLNKLRLNVHIIIDEFRKQRDVEIFYEENSLWCFSVLGGVPLSKPYLLTLKQAIKNTSSVFVPGKL